MTLQMKTIETKALHYRYFCQYLIFFSSNIIIYFMKRVKRVILGKTVPSHVLHNCMVQAALKHALVPIVIQSLDAMQETVKYIKVLQIIYQIYLRLVFFFFKNSKSFHFYARYRNTDFSNFRTINFYIR